MSIVKLLLSLNYVDSLVLHQNFDKQVAIQILHQNLFEDNYHLISDIQ